MSSLTLKQRILNELDNGEKGLSDKIAKLAGYSSGSALRKVLMDEKKEFGKFYGLIKVVQALFPKEEIKLMSEYALTVDPNKQTARYMLEYLNLNSQDEYLHILIDKMINCKNVESQIWGNIYKIDRMVANKEITKTEAINKYSKLVFKSVETEICLGIMKSYCFYDVKEYNLAFQFIKPLREKISEIKEHYIKDVFLGKILSILASCELRMNNVHISRSYCDEILENVEEIRFKLRAYLHKGNSYIMENYNKAIQIFNKGLSLPFIDNRDQNMVLQLKRSINFTNNYWGNEIAYKNLTENEASDLHEEAYQEINKQNFNLALKILNSINFDKMTENEKGFHYYLIGLITKSIDDFGKSVIHFKKSNDYHFIKISLIELQKLGINETLLKAMIN